VTPTQPHQPRRYRHKPGLVETDLGDELVLLDPATRQMFSLNPTGRLLWRDLPEAGLDGAVSQITAGFEVEPDQARADALELVRELVAVGLLESA